MDTVTPVAGDVGDSTTDERQSSSVRGGSFPVITPQILWPMHAAAEFARTTSSRHPLSNSALNSLPPSVNIRHSFHPALFISMATALESKKGSRFLCVFCVNDVRHRITASIIDYQRPLLPYVSEIPDLEGFDADQFSWFLSLHVTNLASCQVASCSLREKTSIRRITMCLKNKHPLRACSRSQPVKDSLRSTRRNNNTLSLPRDSVVWLPVRHDRAMEMIVRSLVAFSWVRHAGHAAVRCERGPFFPYNVNHFFQRG